MTAICAGRLKPDEEKDILVIGSPSSVLVYHVDNNSELFFKEVFEFFLSSNFRILADFIGGKPFHRCRMVSQQQQSEI